MGTVKRIEPPLRLHIRQVRMATEGTEITIVVTKKKLLSAGLMPLTNMWWAQTIKDINPRKIIEPTISL